MTLVQKWLLWMVGLGAGYMVLQSPDAFVKGANAVRSVTAGSIVDVTTGKSH